MPWYQSLLFSRIKSKVLENIRMTAEDAGWLLLLLLQLMTLNYDDAWSDDCHQPSKLAAILRNRQTFWQADRTKQDVISSQFINKQIRNNIIWLQNKWKHIFLGVFLKQWVVLWNTCNFFKEDSIISCSLCDVIMPCMGLWLSCHNMLINITMSYSN